MAPLAGAKARAEGQQQLELCCGLLVDALVAHAALGALPTANDPVSLAEAPETATPSGRATAVISVQVRALALTAAADPLARARGGRRRQRPLAGLQPSSAQRRSVVVGADWH